MADEDYDSILRKAVAAAAATGPLAMSPMPGTDTVAMAGIWATMLVAIAKRSGHHLDADAARRMALAAAASAGGYWTGSKMLTWTIAKIPGPGMVAGSTTNGALNATFTVCLGYLFVDLFEKSEVDTLDVESDMAYLRAGMKPYLSTVMLHRVAAFMKRARHDVQNRKALAKTKS